MKVKDGVEKYTEDFWYDLIHGGYLAPQQILDNDQDIKSVNEAIIVLREYESIIERHMSESVSWRRGEEEDADL